MLLKTKTFGIIILFTAFLNSCRPKSEDAEKKDLRQKSETSVNNWSSGCLLSSDETTPMSIKTDLIKTESSLEIQTNLFLDQNCEELLTTSLKKWSYTSENKSSFLQKIKLKSVSENTVFHNAGFVEVYNLLHPEDQVSAGVNVAKKTDEFCSDYYSMFEEKNGQLKLYSIKANQEEGFSTTSNVYTWFYQ